MRGIYDICPSAGCSRSDSNFEQGALKFSFHGANVPVPFAECGGGLKWLWAMGVELPVIWIESFHLIYGTCITYSLCNETELDPQGSITSSTNGEQFMTIPIPAFGLSSKYSSFLQRVNFANNGPDHEGCLRWTLVASPRTDNSRLVFHLRIWGRPPILHSMAGKTKKKT